MTMWNYLCEYLSKPIINYIMQNNLYKGDFYYVSNLELMGL